MTDSKKNLDELPEKRSDRSIPLNVETLLVEGARKPKLFNPDEENEKLKKDDSDLDTIRGDLMPPEPVPAGTKPPRNQVLEKDGDRHGFRQTIILS